MRCLKSLAGLGLAALLALQAPAHAAPLDLAGVYGGTINGVALIANATGTMETDGSGGHLRIVFDSVPNASFNPMVLGSSYASMIGWVTAQRQNPATLNLYDLGRGDFTLDRWIIWDDPLNEDVRMMGGAQLDGGTLRGVDPHSAALAAHEPTHPVHDARKDIALGERP